MMDAAEKAVWVERVKRVAAEEAGRITEEAMRRLEASPEDWSEVERKIREGVHALGGVMLGAAMRAVGNGYEGSRKLCGCGQTMKYMGDRERKVVSIVGGFRLKRSYYWCPKCHAGDAPLDRRLSMERCDFSPGVQQMISRVGADLPFQRGRKLMGELSGVWVSQRQHQEISERMGASLIPSEPGSPTVACVRKGSRPVEDLYILADGTTAPTTDGWREVKIGAVVEVHVGADGQPQRRGTHYFGDVMEAEPFGWACYRHAQAMGLDRARRAIVLGDGAAWIWNMAQIHFPGAIQIVDWYHATERLWEVAHACFGEGSDQAKQWVHDGEHLLAHSRVEALGERLSRLRPTRAQAKKIVREAIGYFQNNADRMRYERFRRLGLFIGSGIVEAGCKHIVGARFKGSGMRWSLQGLRSILHLRIAVLNGDWPIRLPAAA